MIDWELQPTYRQIKNILAPVCEPSGAFVKHAALYNLKGQLIHVYGPRALHFFGFTQTITNLLKYFKLGAGDTIITNDPSIGSPRLCDINFIRGIYAQNELKGYVVFQLTHEGLLNNKNLLHAKSVDDEGFKIPPTPLDKKGEIKAALLSYLSASGVPAEELSAGFSQAFTAMEQISQSFAILEGKWGKVYLASRLQNLETYTEKIVSKALHRFPDGEVSVVTKFRGEHIHTRLRVRGNSFVIDFTGTSKQRSDSLNCPYSVAMSACFWFFLSMLDEEIPINAGCVRALSVEAPIGSLVNPMGNFASLDGYYELSDVICQNLLKLTQKALPQESAAYQMKSTLHFLLQTSRGTFTYSLGCGTDARMLSPGLDAVKSDWCNDANPSIEEMERCIPFSVTGQSLNLRTSRKHGGLGVSLKLRALDSGRIKVFNNNTPFTEAVLYHGDDKKNSNSKKSLFEGKGVFDFSAGDDISFSTPNGAAEAEVGD